MALPSQANQNSGDSRKCKLCGKWARWQAWYLGARLHWHKAGTDGYTIKYWWRCLTWWTSCKRLVINFVMRVQNQITGMYGKNKFYDTWGNLALKVDIDDISRDGIRVDSCTCVHHLDQISCFGPDMQGQLKPYSWQYHGKKTAKGCSREESEIYADMMAYCKEKRWKALLLADAVEIGCSGFPA